MPVDPSFRTTEITPAGGNAEGDVETAQRWLGLIERARESFDNYNVVSQKVDDLYGSLEYLAGSRADRQFQIFWANLEVLRPSIYARAPVPVVTPRFSDRKPLPRKASELLERALVTVTVESNLHGVLKHVRDDLARNARGVAWVRLDEDGEVEFEHIHRDDFLCDPARSWLECKWVARRVYLSRERVLDLFPSAKLAPLGFNDETKREIKATTEVEVWEIWHRAEKAVVHIAEGVKEVLKRSKPPVDLAGFFPCPQPAFGTLQPGSMIPVPDMTYYQDQIDEIDALTRRVSALTEMIKLKGFYDSSVGDAKDAIETAFATLSDSALLVGVPQLGAFVTGSGGKLIEWFPVAEAANTVQVLIGIRRQLIEDVYQITGLSDIMRGSTVASETATAQNLKAQYGSIRIRERQEEMVRIARDLYRIAAEMLAEKVDGKTLVEMAQMDDLPKRADVQEQVKAILKQAEMAASQAMEQAQVTGRPVDPAQAQEAAQAAQGEVDRLEAQVTVDDVVALLKDQRIRPFVLDIETDSTIAANEDAEKQRRVEFLGAMGQFMGQSLPLVQAQPEAAPLVSAMLRFVASGFRAGRDLEQPIDDFAEKMEQMAGQPRGPSPEQQQAEAEMQAKQAEFQAEQQRAQGEAQLEAMKAQADGIVKQAQAEKLQAETREINMRLQTQGEADADAQFAAALAQEGYAPPMAAIVGAA